MHDPLGYDEVPPRDSDDWWLHLAKLERESDILACLKGRSWPLDEHDGTATLTIKECAPLKIRLVADSDWAVS